MAGGGSLRDAADGAERGGGVVLGDPHQRGGDHEAGQGAHQQVAHAEGLALDLHFRSAPEQQEGHDDDETGGSQSGDGQTTVQGLHDVVVGAEADVLGAEHGAEDAHAADEQGVHHHEVLEFAGEVDGGEQHGGDHGHGVGFKEVGGHTGAVAHVVAHVVGDDGGVARVVFGDAGFDLAHEVGAHVGALREDAAAETREDGDEGSAEAEGHEGFKHGLLFHAEHGQQAIVEDHAEQAEAHDQQTRHGAGLEGHVEGGGHALAGGFSGTDVGTHGNVHADVAGDAGQHRAKHEAQRHKAGKGPSQKHGHDHAHDGDGFVLTVQVRLSALLNSAGNLLHFFRAGTGGEDALGGIIRIVEGEQPASQYHDE